MWVSREIGGIGVQAPVFGLASVSSTVPEYHSMVGRAILIPRSRREWGARRRCLHSQMGRAREMPKRQTGQQHGAARRRGRRGGSHSDFVATRSPAFGPFASACSGCGPPPHYPGSLAWRRSPRHCEKTRDSGGSPPPEHALENGPNAGDLMPTAEWRPPPPVILEGREGNPL